MALDPKDKKVTTEFFKQFSHESCEFYPCHDVPDGESLNCMTCYCPLYWLECPGNFSIIDSKGVPRKDCSECTIIHGKDGWDTVQKILKKPRIWKSRILH
ncbi:MAG: hypothetical protein KAS32_23180 [Candidatus Peribacteraceae bacterium]|nr:hypothetical protein [Candidatus Peribacteraceae bacterium]